MSVLVNTSKSGKPVLASGFARVKAAKALAKKESKALKAHPLALGLARMNGTGGAIVAYLTGARWQYFASAQDLLLIRPISQTFVTEREIRELGSLLPKQSWNTRK